MYIIERTSTFGAVKIIDITFIYRDVSSAIGLASVATELDVKMGIKNVEYVVHEYYDHEEIPF